MSGLERWRPGTGEWDLGAATHLLERAGFGPGPGEAESLLEGDVEAAVEALFQPKGHHPILLAGVQSVVSAGDTDGLGAWWLELMRRGGDPLGERLVLMWHDHFATSDAKVMDTRLMYGQNRLFRELGRGDFREMVQAVAKDPCMLKWLDGDKNRAGQPNENFAREVMELFVLGIGHYSEADVRELARALSGMGTRGTGGREFVFRERDHDAGEKTILGETGNFDGATALNFVMAEPAAARHVARRILVEFLGYEPHADLLNESALELLSKDWGIGKFVSKVLLSKAFFGPRARRSRIAGPVELILRLVRRLDAKVPAVELGRSVRDMGQRLFYPPSVKGWDGGGVWINAGTWVARHNALLQVLERADVEGTLGGQSASGDQAADFVLSSLLPSLGEGELQTALRAACAGSRFQEAAMERALALLVTTPEYQLI